MVRSLVTGHIPACSLFSWRLPQLYFDKSKFRQLEYSERSLIESLCEKNSTDPKPVGASKDTWILLATKLDCPLLVLLTLFTDKRS